MVPSFSPSFHTRMVLSSPPAATREPSGESAMVLTPSVGSESV